jgi:indole-3-glycerol phosphate synthase
MKRSFSGSILTASASGLLPLAADIKPASPRDGELVSGRDPVELALNLEKAGVCALSVVTEPERFGGSMELLRLVAGAVSLPVLRKDFITSARQIDETVESGASAVLLTVATIPELEIPGLYRRAVSLGLEPVVEVHTAAELHFALGLEPKPTVVGINNRDITVLEKDDGDVRVTETLAPLVPEGIAILSESSMLTPGDVARALAAGAHAVLVGTAVLLASDPGERARELAGFAGGM